MYEVLLISAQLHRCWYDCMADTQHWIVLESRARYVLPIHDLYGPSCYFNALRGQSELRFVAVQPDALQQLKQ